jgi:coenzyme PQQ precursor peptide PqqA
MDCIAPSAMQHTTWTRPEFREINLSAEIGMYVEIDEDTQFDEIQPEDDLSPVRN